MLNKPVKLNVPENVHEKLKIEITRGRPVSVKLKLDGARTGDHTLLHTRGQISKVDRACMIGGGGGEC